MNWLPNTRDPLLRATIVAAELGCCWSVYIGLYNTFHYGPDTSIIFLVVLVAIGYGLWKLRYWGRRLAIAYLWLSLLVIGGPLGKLSIIDAINADHPPYPLWQTWWEEMFPIAAPVAFLLEVLTAYRREFDDARNQVGPPGWSRLPRSWLSWYIAVYGVPTAMVGLMIHGSAPNTGCPPHTLWDPLAIWYWAAGVVALLGCVLFVMNASAAVTRKGRILRATMYLLGALCLLQGAPSYLWYANGCMASP